MKKRIVSTFIVAILLVLIIFPSNSQASTVNPIIPDSENELVELKTTAYCTGTICASGVKPRKYICAGAETFLKDADEDGSWVAMVWLIDENGNATDFQGYWEILDTGSEPIKKGYVLDMYFPTLEECQEWMELTKGKILVKYIYAYG